MASNLNYLLTDEVQELLEWTYGPSSLAIMSDDAREASATPADSRFSTLAGALRPLPASDEKTVDRTGKRDPFRCPRIGEAPSDWGSDFGRGANELVARWPESDQDTYLLIEYLQHTWRNAVYHRSHKPTIWSTSANPIAPQTNWKRMIGILTAVRTRCALLAFADYDCPAAELAGYLVFTSTRKTLCRTVGTAFPPDFVFNRDILIELLEATTTEYELVISKCLLAQLVKEAKAASEAKGKTWSGSLWVYSPLPSQAILWTTLGFQCCPFITASKSTGPLLSSLPTIVAKQPGASSVSAASAAFAAAAVAASTTSNALAPATLNNQWFVRSINL